MTYVVVGLSLALMAAVVVALIAWRRMGQAQTSSRGPSRRASQAPVGGSLEELPEAGILVPDEIVGAVGLDNSRLMEVLRQSATPVALEYRPVSAEEMSQLRTIKPNAAAQRAMTQIMKAAGPKSPTLYTAHLPAGSELARAAGGAGYRGFAQAGGRISAHAILKPVGVGAAAATAWPVVAVAVTVMLLDQVAQRQQREFQHRAMQLLQRQAEDAYRQRFSDLQAIDLELSEVIARMLDGQQVYGAWEHARFAATQQLVYAKRLISDRLESAKAVVNDGRADHKSLSRALGGARRPSSQFYKDLELARGAVALGGKAALANAVATALQDPENPYIALRAVLEDRFNEVAVAEAQLEELTSLLSEVRVTGGGIAWLRDEERNMQKVLRSQLSRPEGDEAGRPVRFLAMPSGEVLQVESTRDDAETEPEASASST